MDVRLVEPPACRSTSYQSKSNRISGDCDETRQARDQTSPREGLSQLGILARVGPLSSGSSCELPGLTCRLRADRHFDRIIAGVEVLRPNLIERILQSVFRLFDLPLGCRPRSTFGGLQFDIEEVVSGCGVDRLFLHYFAALVFDADKALARVLRVDVDLYDRIGRRRRDASAKAASPSAPATTTSAKRPVGVSPHIVHGKDFEVGCPELRRQVVNLRERQNPSTTRVSSDHKVVLASLDYKVVNRDMR